MSSSTESSREKLAGLTLDDVLANQKRSASAQFALGQPPPPLKSRTLLDIIKEDENNKKDRRSWKAFKDKLRLKRAGSAWTSSIPIPTSDIPVQNPNSRSFSQFGRRNSVRFQTHFDSDMSTHQVDDLDPPDHSSDAQPSRPQFTRRSSTRFTTDSSDNNPTGPLLRPTLSRRNSTSVPSEQFRRGRVVTFRDSFDDEEPDDENQRHPETGRALSAREAVAAQEAAEAAAAEESGGQTPTTMSLMDLLTETDREMGLEGSRYILSDDEDFEDDDEEEGDADVDGEGAMEHTCCICMVKHKGSAFVPCGHSFCRMCSKELMVTKGNCPLCNNFILEILEIF